MSRVLTALAVLSATLILLVGCAAQSGDVLLRLDPLDPLSETIRNQGVECEILRDRSIIQRAPNYSGLLFVSELQAGMLENTGLSFQTVMRKPCRMVIAVNRERTDEAVTGYRQLLDSSLVVTIPHQDSDAGKTLALALSSVLGTDENSWDSGLAYLAELNAKGRLLISSTEDNALLTPRLAGKADAVLCWDYQAGMLQKSGDWQIIIPEEGSYRSAQLLVATEGTVVPAALTTTLREEGWSYGSDGPETVTPATMRALAAFKADFRRVVIAGTRRYATASVPEKAAVNGVMLLTMLSLYLYIGLHMRTRFVLRAYILLAASLLCWLLISLMKLFVWTEPAVLALWYGFYPCMLAAAMAWYALSYALRHQKHLPRRALAAMAALLAMFTVLVSTNTLHQQVFRFIDQSIVFWYNNYTYGWGYWSFFAVCSVFLFAGLYEYGRFSLKKRDHISFLSFFIGLALILTLNLLNTFHISNGLYLDIAWQTNLLAALAVLSALRARFLDPAVSWDRMFTRMRLPVDVWNGSVTVYESEAFRRLEPAFYAGERMPAGEARAVDGSWYRLIERDEGDLQMMVLENVSDQIAAKKAVEAQHELAEQNRLLAERRLKKSQAMLEQFSSIVQDSQYNRLLRSGMETLDGQMDRLRPDATIEELRCVQFTSGHCSRLLRLMLWSMEHRPLPADGFTALLDGACSDAQMCGISVTLTSALQTALDARTAIATECCFTLLLQAVLRQKDTVLSIRLQQDGKAVRMVVLLSEPGDFSVLYETATSFGVSLEQQMDDSTTILKLKFPGGAI